MQELTRILQDGTAGVTRDYFRLNIAGGIPVYRERVYCYELYHQMRKRWPGPCPYRLNGEVDKSAHPILKDLKQKPDLLVHGPGYMHKNHAIIEVKSADVKRRQSGLIKDLRTLLLFRRRAGYERAVLLVYGNESESVASGARERYAKLNGDSEIEVWVHTAPEQPARQVDLLRPLSV